MKKGEKARRLGLPYQLRRPYLVMTTVNFEENEFITRKSYAEGIPKTILLRRGVLNRSWKSELRKLRESQQDMPAEKLYRLAIKRTRRD